MFHAGSHSDFGVSRRLAVKLAEILQIINGEVVARQMQQCILEHGTVAVGKKETVAPSI